MDKQQASELRRVRRGQASADFRSLAGPEAPGPRHKALTAQAFIQKARSWFIPLRRDADAHQGSV